MYQSQIWQGNVDLHRRTLFANGTLSNTRLCSGGWR